jgi:hypothetical protein
LVLTVNSGKAVKVQVGLEAAVDVATTADLQSVNQNLTAIQNDVAMVAGVETTLVNLVNDLQRQLTAAASDAESTSASAAAALRRVAALENQLEQAPVSTCSMPSAPSHGAVALATGAYELVPGAAIAFSCDASYVLSSSPRFTCLTNGSLAPAGPAPTCRHQPVRGLSRATAAASCREIFDLNQANDGSPLASGAYWIQNLLGSTSLQVWCDMNTTTPQGKSGWTLCGKYDRARAGPRYLSNGFGRAVNQQDDMATIGTFSGSNIRWSSLDCRRLINDRSAYMMHAATNTPQMARAGTAGVNLYYDKVRFTNVFVNTRGNPNNFFDTSNEHAGSCWSRTHSPPGVRTWDERWRSLTRDGVNDLSSGHCHVGAGTMLCSRNRVGSRFSNAGVDGCGGTADDTIYWAWDSDDHGCGRDFVIGTGCQVASSTTWRYNLLYLW